jgi:hypothetical protein
MGRIERGWRLVVASAHVLRMDGELLVLPILSFVAMALVVASVGGAAWTSGLLIVPAGEHPNPLAYVLLGVVYFLCTFISVFFNAAVVGIATIRLGGGDPKIGDGFALAASKIGKIAAWAAVTATVGLILRAARGRRNLLGRLVAAIVGAAWSAITFFVIPVLLYEPVGVFAGLKRSATLFKERWGEQFTGDAAIGLILFLFALPLLVLGGFLVAVSPVAGIAVLVLTIGGLVSFGGAMSGVFHAALYRYATTGHGGTGFTDEDLAGAFRAR